MATIEVTYMSQALWRTVPVQVILPADKATVTGELLPLKQYKTLYLLHGLHGSSMDWMTRTRILRWASERDLAVVMPSGDNSYYVDRVDGRNCYGEFVGSELVEMTRRMFPLSHKREDTFIGGLSMGGFGAVRNGLKYADTFGYIISLSGALHIFEGSGGVSTSEGPFGISLFGPAKEAAVSDKNPRVLIKQLVERRKAEPDFELPKIYMACGDDDFLLPSNKIYKALFEEAGFDLTYVQSPGTHSWDYWDEHILKALDWLPLAEKNEGMGSGNIAQVVRK